MDSYSAQFYQQQSKGYQNCVTLYQCGYPSSEGYSSLSPASSSDSCDLSPPYMSCSKYEDFFGSIPATNTQMADRRDKNISPEQRKKRKGKLAYSQRQSASEREKMRMRNLSKALQNLRRFLPPAVAPADKNLTKIETLQLAMSYISHLSSQLGLSEEVLEQRRQAALQANNSCQYGLSSYMGKPQRLCSQTASESFNPATDLTGLYSETSPLLAEPVVQGIDATCQQPYEVPYIPELETATLQPHYTSTSTLSQPQDHYYTTGPQQLGVYYEILQDHVEILQEYSKQITDDADWLRVYSCSSR
ncbi:uncharacterized protein LOC128664545 [Bombina bombina]|uniref:uncharacterized protein LOC128664545 n=1 Tax=Bombina bombina TaxID=8345 RepID=UPI00235AF012|nr:uncharacterized protein LOC128664545 [Bombina bombina]